MGTEKGRCRELGAVNVELLGVEGPVIRSMATVGQTKSYAPHLPDTDSLENASENPPVLNGIATAFPPEETTSLISGLLNGDHLLQCRAGADLGETLVSDLRSSSPRLSVIRGTPPPSPSPDSHTLLK